MGRGLLAEEERGGEGMCEGPRGGAGMGMGAMKPGLSFIVAAATREGARDLGGSVLVDLGGASDFAGAGLLEMVSSGRVG